MRRLFALLLLAGLPSLAASHRSAPRSERRDEGRPRLCVSCDRNAQGRIRRSAAARNEFRREHPCPATAEVRRTCTGYVIDHIVPLKRGGADDPSNMQWQSVAEAKAKDRWE